MVSVTQRQIDKLISFLETNNRLPIVKETKDYYCYTNVRLLYKEKGPEGFSPEVVSKLESFEFWSWVGRFDGDKRFEELIDFLKEKKRCPFSKSKEERIMYDYCLLLRKHYSNEKTRSKITEEMLQRLSEHECWYWTRKDNVTTALSNGNVPRYTRILELVDYIKKNKRPIRKSLDGISFSRFVVSLRVDYKDKILTEKEIELLESCKPYWFWSYADECKENNLEAVRELGQWINEHGFLPSSGSECAIEKKFNYMLNRYRLAYKGKSHAYIDEDIIKALESIPLWTWQDNGQTRERKRRESLKEVEYKEKSETKSIKLPRIPREERKELRSEPKPLRAPKPIKPPRIPREERVKLRSEPKPPRAPKPINDLVHYTNVPNSDMPDFPRNIENAKILVRWIEKNGRLPIKNQSEEEDMYYKQMKTFRLSHNSSKGYLNNTAINILNGCYLWSWKHVNTREYLSIVRKNSIEVRAKEYRRKLQELLEWMDKHGRMPNTRDSKTPEHKHHSNIATRFRNAYVRPNMGFLYECPDIYKVLDEHPLWTWPKRNKAKIDDLASNTPRCNKKKRNILALLMEPWDHPEIMDYVIEDCEEILHLFYLNDVSVRGKKNNFTIDIGDYLKADIVIAIFKCIHEGKTDTDIYNEVDIELFWIKVLRYLIFVNNCGTNIEDAYYLYVETMDNSYKYRGELIV